MPKHLSFVLICLFFVSGRAVAQNNPCTDFDKDGIKMVLEILAHPALGGRGTLQPGFDVAGLILARELRNFGFSPLPGNSEGYFHSFPVYTGKKPGGEISRNVVAYLPGEKDEYVIIGAHYDHIGIWNGKIYPGADDNASGTTAVLEIAKVLGRYVGSGGKLKRGIVVGFWGAEEAGLLGSMAFAVSDLIPRDKRIAYINLDMVGRNAPDYLVAIGSESKYDFKIVSPDLAMILKKENDRLANPFVLDYDDGGENLFRRSDQFSFFAASKPDRRLPVLFLNTSLHADYHKTTDTPEKVNMEKIARVACLSHAIVLHLSNSTRRPVYVNR